MNHQERAEYNGLSIAALVFGILAVLGSFTILATPLLASLAISFAWLSRGERKMHWQAITGNVLAVLSIVISLTLILLLLTAALSGFGGRLPDPGTAIPFPIDEFGDLAPMLPPGILP